MEKPFARVQHEKSSRLQQQPRHDFVMGQGYYFTIHDSHRFKINHNQNNMTVRKFLVGGNWKMNGSVAQLNSLCSQLVSAKFDSTQTGTLILLHSHVHIIHIYMFLLLVEVVVAPAAVYLE